jgi:methionine-rich copper-binding protein CopC
VLIRPASLSLILLLVAVVGCAPTVASPPRLISLSPSIDASLPIEPQTFELTFNRPLRVDQSWVAIWREMDGAPLDVESTVESHRLRLRIGKPEAGEYRVHWHVVSARTASEADGEQPIAFQDESRNPPRLEVVQQSADSGDKFELKGTGFARRATLQLAIGDDGQELKTVQLDARGSFDEEARVPRGVPFGMQPIVATDSEGASATAGLQVRWGGWPPVVAYTSGVPGPGAGEVTLSLSVRNRSDYMLEKVRVVLSDPGELTGFQPDGSHRDGAVVWDIGTLDRGVVGPLRATYRVGGPVVSHARIEFRHRKPRGCTGDECLPAFVSETSSDSTPIAPVV